MVLLDGKKVPRENIPAHCEFSQKAQRHARDVLREQIRRCPDWATKNIDADVIVEQVWNAMTGLDKPAKS